MSFPLNLGDGRWLWFGVELIIALTMQNKQSLDLIKNCSLQIWYFGGLNMQNNLLLQNGLGS